MTSSSQALATAVLSACILSALACTGGDEALSPAEQAAATQQKNLDQYEDATRRLEERRTLFKDKRAKELAAHGDTLFWLEFAGFEPTLFSLDKGSGEQTEYDFSISTDADYTWEGSDQLIATARPEGDKVTYEVYEVGSAAKALGSFELEKPQGAKWWAYSVDARTVWVIQDEPGRHALLSWEPGGVLTPVTTLEELGIEPGLLQDFEIHDNQLLLVESGRLWEADLETESARWLQNEEEVRSASFDRDGVLYGQPTKGLVHVSLRDKKLRNVSQELFEHDYFFNSTYPDLHHYTGNGAVLDGELVYYLSTNGALMRYDLAQRTVCPVLLEPRYDPQAVQPIKVTYSNPVISQDGTIYVTGLESTSGATGAEGPIWSVSPGCSKRQ